MRPDIERLLREAADLAERAAVARQHAELDGPRSDPAVTSGFQLAAEALRHAARAIGPPPPGSRRAVAGSALTTAVWVIFCVAVLLTVPNPAQPVVLAITLAGGGVVSTLVAGVVDPIWDRRDARRLTAATSDPTNARRTIAELRTRISAITFALEPDRDRRHLEAGRRMESAKVWIDAADYALAETSEG